MITTKPPLGQQLSTAERLEKTQHLVYVVTLISIINMLMLIYDTAFLYHLQHLINAIVSLV